MRLRRAIAQRCPEEISLHYQYLLDNLNYLFLHKEIADKYDERTDQLYLKLPSYRKVLDFLYASDCGATLTYGTAKDLLKAIGDYDDDIIYGYAGWGEKAARFKDFRQLLEDSVATKSKFRWY